ncbi:MAG: phosphoesterase [Chloroflexi bacterium]|nr:phosphoesterase [Chloroflexota bacterium]
MLTRRQFLRGALGATAVTAFTGFYTFKIEPYWVKYEHLPLPIRNLPPELEGKTLVQLSDLHIGSQFNWQTISNQLQRVQQLTPDFVVYTGDFVSYNTATQFDQLRGVMQHTPHGKLGTLAILGNHDYGYGWSQSEVAAEIVTILNDVEIDVLRNEVRDVAGLQIAGIDDYWGTNYAPEQVTAVLSPNTPTLILCHNPDVADQPVWNGYQGWILSGHTHGGQVKPPFLPPPVLPVENKRYTAGVFDVGNGRSLYINRGLGNLLSVRFNVRPEITIFTLTGTSI